MIGMIFSKMIQSKEKRNEIAQTALSGMVKTWLIDEI